MTYDYEKNEKLRMEAQQKSQQLQKMLVDAGTLSGDIADILGSIRIPAHQAAGQATGQANGTEGTLMDNLLTVDGQAAGLTGADTLFQHGVDHLAFHNNSASVTQVLKPNDRGSTRTQIHRIITLRKTRTVRFEVFFPEDYEWVHGGKFGFGFLGGCNFPKLNTPHPTWPAGGGINKPSSCSCRFMWRADGLIVAYVYRQNKRQPGYKYGEDFKAFKIPRGRWIPIRMTARMNSHVDTADGVLEIEVAGRSSRFDGIKWISEGALGWTRLMYEAFYGGSSSWWSPQVSNSYGIRNVRVS